MSMLLYINIAVVVLIVLVIALLMWIVYDDIKKGKAGVVSKDETVR